MSYGEVHEELKDFLHRSRIPAINQSWMLANLIATEGTTINRIEYYVVLYNALSIVPVSSKIYSSTVIIDSEPILHEMLQK